MSYISTTDLPEKMVITYRPTNPAHDPLYEIEYAYGYDTSNRVNTFTYKIKDLTATPVVTRSVRQMRYEYYTNGQLKTYGVWENTAQGTSAPNWQEIDTTFYSYHKASGTPSTGLLKHIVGPLAYKQMKAVNPTWPELASDADLNNYADRKYAEYDDAYRVKTLVTRGGRYTYGFAYSVSTHSPGSNFNVWTTKTVVTHPDGSGRVLYFNKAGQLMLRRVQDNAMGWLLSTSIGTDDGSPGNMVLVQENQYDGGTQGVGNLTQVTLHPTASSGSDRVTTFRYDWRLRLEETEATVEADGGGTNTLITKRAYDNRSNVTSLSEFKTNTSSANLIGQRKFYFDTRNRRYRGEVYAVNSSGTASTPQTSNTYYGSCGRALREEPAGSSTFTVTTFDRVSRLEKTYVGYVPSGTSQPTDPTDISTSVIMEQSANAYDAASNLISTLTRSRQDDATGAGVLQDPSTQPKARLAYTAYYPDSLGRQQAVAAYGTNGGSSWTRSATIPTRSDTVLVSSNGYDSAGNTVLTSDPQATLTSFTYDKADRLTIQIENAPASSSSSSSSSSGGSVPSYRTTYHEYTDDGLLKKLKCDDSSTGQQVTEWVYGVDTGKGSALTSNVLVYQKIYPDSTGSTDRVTYKYNRLGQATEMKDQAGTVHSYFYDKLGRFLTDLATLAAGSSLDNSTGKIEVGYDQMGNWLSYYSQSPALSQTRAHNKANEITSLTNPTSVIQPAYDAVGNMTTLPQPADWTKKFTARWDAWNRLIKLTDDNGTTVVATYAYDGLFRRITKTTGSETRKFYYTDSWQVAEEYVGTSSTPQRRYYWGMREINDLIRRQRYSSGTTLQDDLYALGDRMNVVAVVDASGAVQQRMGYSAFGTPIWLTSAWAASTNTKEWNVLFHGHFLDGESGLYQMRFRYFQTGLGRWTSRDPIGETGGFNLYQAFSNDPASQKDVFGLELNFPEPEFPKSTAKPLPDGRRWLGITNCSISLQISCEPCEESGCAKIKHSLTMNVTTTIPTLVDPMRRDGKVGPAIPLSQNILNLLRAHEDKHRQDCKNFHDYWSNALEANANASACAMDKATCEEVVKTLKNAFDIARAQLDARRDHAGGDDHWAEMKAIEDALQKERWSQFNGGK